MHTTVKRLNFSILLAEAIDKWIFCNVASNRIRSCSSWSSGWNGNGHLLSSKVKSTDLLYMCMCGGIFVFGKIPKLWNPFTRTDSMRFVDSERFLPTSYFSQEKWIFCLVRIFTLLVRSNFFSLQIHTFQKIKDWLGWSLMCVSYNEHFTTASDFVPGEFFWGYWQKIDAYVWEHHWPCD